MAVVLTLVQTKQTRIIIHKGRLCVFICMCMYVINVTAELEAILPGL